MFTTLPLELFVCREVRMRGSRDFRVELNIAKVLEQFFFSHEGFSYQRHLIFTTVILFSSMFSEFSCHTLIRNLASPFFSLTGHL
jgi:solute carrier family 38 (sodium-coupled neutral amino acid transporter), member 11